jgi:predicted secreted protein
MTIRVHTTSTTVAVTNLLSNDLDVNIDMEEVTTKDSGEFKEWLARFADAKLGFSGIYSSTASATGYEDLEGWAFAKTKIFWEFGTGVAATRKISGQGYIDNVKLDAPHDGSVTFSGSIQNTGDPTVATYP